MTYTRRTTLIAQQTSINNQASFPEILSWTGIKRSLPIALLLCVEREKRTTNIRFYIGIDEGHSQLAWEASQLARPARSLKLFGTFLTFFSAIHFFFSFDCFSHFVWTHLLAWFEFAPCCTAGQLQLLSSWLTTLVVDDVPPPTSWQLLSLALSSAGCFIIWADEINWKTFEIRLGSSGTYNFLQNWILNSARATQRKQSAVAAWLALRHRLPWCD